MKLKKLASGVTILAMSTLLLAACGGDKDKKDDKGTEASSSEVVKAESSESKADDTEKADKADDAAKDGDLKDGEYTLEEKNEKNGYRTVFTIVVTDGKISESNYDNVNKDGESKINDDEYNKKMEEVAKTSPDKFIPELNKELVEKQDPKDIDTVTGATHSTDSFKEYATQLVEAAKKGDTTKIEVDNQVDE